ncbi:MAG: hypothetical protein CFE21_08300 [Bacteroidetes bacterium B1(2017)]|nr:MAG: hypothetical protein CFE21_08300 [Bacteroidetes bacterium B1(2017)]
MFNQLKKTLLTFCFFLLASQAFSQAALLVLIFGDKVASEKFHLSIDGGLNYASMPGLSKQSPTTGVYFGLGTFIKLNDKWALTPEFKPLSPRGAKEVAPIRDYSAVISDAKYNLKLNYIDIPVLVQYKITPRLFVATGPQMSYLTSAQQVSNGKLPLGSTVDINEDMKSNFNSFYFSVPIELGYSISTLRGGKGIDIKLRYNVGISDLLSNTTYGSSMGSTFQAYLSFPFINPQ